MGRYLAVIMVGGSAIYIVISCSIANDLIFLSFILFIYIYILIIIYDNNNYDLNIKYIYRFVDTVYVLIWLMTLPRYRDNKCTTCKIVSTLKQLNKYIF